MLRARKTEVSLIVNSTVNPKYVDNIYYLTFLRRIFYSRFKQKRIRRVYMLAGQNIFHSMIGQCILRYNAYQVTVVYKFYVDVGIIF